MTELIYHNGSLTGKKYKCDVEFKYQVAIPQVDVESYGLWVDHDGPNNANLNSMTKLADEGKAPYCVGIGVQPGELPLPDGTRRYMRMNCYDMFEREYSDFLIYELIPHIEKEYNLNISESPDMHLVSGSSSGGLSSFLIAWFHPDYFHRVYMSSPSFLAMGRGNEIPYLIRKCETKPLRIYEEYSENEPNDYFGCSRPIDEEAREALIFANYDFKYAYFPNEGHISRCGNNDEAYARNEWLWKDWQNSGITAPSNSSRVNKVIPPESKWEVCDTFPESENQVSNILTNEYKTVVLSNDKNVWYTANENDQSVYMFVNNDEISINKRFTHAMLHTMPNQVVTGVIDMVVDKVDRLFALTEIGIQCIRSCGFIDVILDLPDSAKPQKITVTDALYVMTENGIYKRALCESCITDSETKRKHIYYTD